jgi:hypothetical protein
VPSIGAGTAGSSPGGGSSGDFGSRSEGTTNHDTAPAGAKNLATRFSATV